MSDSFKVFLLSLKRGLIVAGIFFIVKLVMQHLFNRPVDSSSSFFFPIFMGAISGLRVYWTESSASFIQKTGVHFVILWGVLWLTFMYIPKLNDGILYNALASLLLSAFLTWIRAVFIKERSNS